MRERHKGPGKKAMKERTEATRKNQEGKTQQILERYGKNQWIPCV